MKKRSNRAKLIDKIDDILLQVLFYERGKKCEICGSTRSKLGLFHILPKGRYPKLRFHKNNLLIAGWFCCHFFWHHDPYIARDRIFPRIKEIKGDDYEDKLKIQDLTAPSLDDHRLNLIKRVLEKELKEHEKNWENGL